MAYETEVRPVRWMPRGEAVCEARGRNPLRVWSGIPGERARVRVVHEGRHQSAALWLSSAEPDAHRVHPPCEKYTPCGGCPIMHLDASGQVLARRALVRQALDESGLSEVVVGQHHECPDGHADFRHVVKVGVGHSENGRIRVGAWGRRSRRVVAIPDCPVAAPVLNRTMKSLAHFIIELGLHPYDANTDRGVLRSAVLRASRSTGEVLITLVAGRRTSQLQTLAMEVVRGVPEVVGVWLHLNDGPGNAIFVRDNEGVVGARPLEGSGWIEEELCGVRYRIGPGDFFQTNPATAAVLYERVIDRLDLSDGDTFLDLYCGVGGWALQAASRGVGFALGIDEVAGVVTRAKDAARLNRLTAEFQHDRVADALPDLTRRFADLRPTVLVNPARRGLEDGVPAAIVGLKPRQIAYISCNPRAMARDLAIFAEHGFGIGEVEMFDMFPNTAHVECAVVLQSPEDVVRHRRAPRRRVVSR